MWNATRRYNPLRGHHSPKPPPSDTGSALLHESGARQFVGFGYLNLRCYAASLALGSQGHHSPKPPPSDTGSVFCFVCVVSQCICIGVVNFQRCRVAPVPLLLFFRENISGGFFLFFHCYLLLPVDICVYVLLHDFLFFVFKKRCRHLFLPL
jgi:hypothetical protein